MTKRRLMYILFFVVIVPVVLASDEEQIYSRTVRSDEVVIDSVRGYTFELRVAGNSGVYVNLGNYSILVLSSDCEWEGDLKLCAGKATYLYRNRATWKDVYSFPFYILLRKGFAFNKTIEKTKLMIDEKSRVKVEFLNDGATEIPSITYNDSYPLSLEVVDVDGCSLNNNVVEWNGSLGPLSSKKCTYTLVARDGIVYKSEAEISYYDGWERQDASPHGIKIKVQNHSLKTTPVLNITQNDIGGLVNASLTVTNINNYKIPVRLFRIDVPQGLKIVRNSNDLNYKGAFLFWKGILKGLEQKNFSFSLRPEESGNYTVRIAESYLDSIYEKNFIHTINFTIDCDCLLIRHTFSRKDEQTAHLKIILSNPSTNNQFNNVKLSISTNIPHANNVQHDYIFLSPGEDITLFNDDIALQGLSYHYDIVVEYESEFRQHFEERKYILIPGELLNITVEETTADRSAPEAEILPESEIIVPADQGSDEQESEMQFLYNENETSGGPSKIKELAPLAMIIFLLVVLVAYLSMRAHHKQHRKRMRKRSK